MMLEGPRTLPSLLDNLRKRSESVPGDIDLILKLARLYRRNGAWDKAAETYDRLLAASFDHPAGLVESALCLARLDNMSEAEFRLGRAQEVHPEPVEVFLAWAELHQLRPDPEAEITALMRAANAAPDRPDVRLRLAERLSRHGDEAGALAQYRLLAERFPAHHGIRNALAGLLMHQDTLDEAVRQLQAVVSLNPSDHQAWFDLARCQFRRGAYVEAIPCFHYALKGLKDSLPARFLLARCYEKLEDFDRALVMLERMADGNPESLDVLRFLAETYVRVGETDSAIDVFGRLVTLYPERPEFALRRAELLLERKDHARAAQVLYQLFARHPGHIEGHRLMGEVRIAQGKLREALNEYQNTILADEAFLPGWVGCARVYHLLGEESDEYKTLQRALELRSDDVEILFRLGELERKLKKPASLDRFRRILELSPHSRRAREAAYFLRHTRG